MKGRGSQSLRSTAMVESAITGVGSINGTEGRQGRKVDSRTLEADAEIGMRVLETTGVSEAPGSEAVTDRGSWVEASIWSERMLAALNRG